ncbi:MAG: OmpA family protein [Myxococcota bacterium]|jgi:peptidoglycan-associated lipoprotein
MGLRSTARWLIPATGLLALGLVACATDTATAPSASTQEFRDPPPMETSSRSSLASLQTVYFDLDRHEIRADAKSALKENARAIAINKDWGTITIEGYCDERGSEEYNLALGEKRARAVKRYLSDLGVPASRLDVVSYGEAAPAVMGHDESAWRYNRRSEFKSRN